MSIQGENSATQHNQNPQYGAYLYHPPKNSFQKYHCDAHPVQPVDHLRHNALRFFYSADSREKKDIYGRSHGVEKKEKKRKKGHPKKKKRTPKKFLTNTSNPIIIPLRHKHSEQPYDPSPQRTYRR